MPMHNASAALQLPGVLQRPLDRMAVQLLNAPGVPAVDFSQPPGEPALVAPDSVSWQIFKNPVALFVGGVAAVILELAHPRVRSGVWEHTRFRTEPMARLQRTGMAAMVTVYGAQGVARQMIAGVARRHAQVQGHTPAGEAYSASDPDLLDWVQATAAFGFAHAYDAYVRPLRPEQFDQLYREGAPSARLYGALGAPTSRDQMQAAFDAMAGQLEASPIVLEFLDIMMRAPVFPAPLRPMQRSLVRAAVDITPAWLRERLGLGPAHGLGRIERRAIRWAGALADRVMLQDSPAVQACRRLGLPPDYLYRAQPQAR